MTTDVFQANMAGRVVRFTFRDAQTRQFFRSWLRPCGEAADLIASPEELAAARALMRETDPPAAVEFKALCGLTGRFLLRWDCCLFHAVAFLFQGRAWLLTAPSGTGKTTQFMNWRKLAASEILMISGDIPVLELREDGIWVHPSPWNGKEAIGSLHSAPLGGIVLLEQGKENRIGRLSTREAIEALFTQFTFTPETEEEIRACCRIMEGLLAQPVWKLVNLGDIASTELLRKTLLGGNDGTI